MILSIVVPVVGAIISICYILFKNIAEDKSEDTRAWMCQQDEANLLYNYSNSDIAIVPIKDALVLNEKEIKRKLLIHAIKDDGKEYIMAAKEALNDEDTETSHYAASVLTHFASQMPEEIKENEDEYIKSNKEIKAAIKYYESLKVYLKSNINEKMFINEYEEKYIDILKELVKSEESLEIYYRDILEILIKQRRFKEAEEYLKDYKNKYRYLDEPYIISLKLAYIKKDYAVFNKELEFLKKSDIKIKGENLEIIRYWTNEV